MKDSEMEDSVFDVLGMTPEDRRKFRRYRVSLSVLVQPAAPSEVSGEVRPARRVQRAAVVTDISMAGLIFLSPVSYSIGSLIDIQITLGAVCYKVQALVRRSHIQPLPGHRAWACGAQFVRGEQIARFVPAVAKYLLRRAHPTSE